MKCCNEASFRRCRRTFAISLSRSRFASRCAILRGITGACNRMLRRRRACVLTCLCRILKRADPTFRVRVVSTADIDALMTTSTGAMSSRVAFKTQADKRASSFRAPAHQSAVPSTERRESAQQLASSDAGLRPAVPTVPGRSAHSDTRLLHDSVASRSLAGSGHSVGAESAPRRVPQAARVAVVAAVASTPVTEDHGAAFSGTDVLLLQRLEVQGAAVEELRGSLRRVLGSVVELRRDVQVSCCVLVCCVCCGANQAGARTHNRRQWCSPRPQERRDGWSRLW